MSSSLSFTDYHSTRCALPPFGNLAARKRSGGWERLAVLVWVDWPCQNFDLVLAFSLGDQEVSYSTVILYVCENHPPTKLQSAYEYCLS